VYRRPVDLSGVDDPFPLSVKYALTLIAKSLRLPPPPHPLRGRERVGCARLPVDLVKLKGVLVPMSKRRDDRSPYDLRRLRDNRSATVLHRDDWSELPYPVCVHTGENLLL